MDSNYEDMLNEQLIVKDDEEVLCEEEEEFKIFELPVVYKMQGVIGIQANTLEEAIEYFKDNVNDIELPEEPEYVLDSYRIASDDIDYLKEFNGIKTDII